MSKTRQIAEEIRNFIDNKVGKLSQEEYLEVLQDVISILEGYEDCVKSELGVD